MIYTITKMGFMDKPYTSTIYIYTVVNVVMQISLIFPSNTSKLMQYFGTNTWLIYKNECVHMYCLIKCFNVVRVETHVLSSF